MIASLDNSSSLQYYDIISLADSLESMCYDDDGATLEEVIECDSDSLF
jgi:hypothetical protein